MPRILMLAACAVLAVLAAGAEPTFAETVATPFILRQVSGTRPFVEVRLNGHPFQFMVHANANFYAMTTHANARAAGVDVPPATSTYGIEHTGKVSALGRSRATLADLEVGGRHYRQVSLSVFEAHRPRS